MKPGSVAIAGIGATEIYRRGRSSPRTLTELLGEAILAALRDAGLTVKDVDGFAYFAGGFDTGLLMEMLGIEDVTFSASITGTGGGSAGCIGLAATAITAGEASTIICVGANQQTQTRFGSITAGSAATAESAFFDTAGLVGPGQIFALLACRHMHLFGTTRDDFASVALTARDNAQRNPGALMTEALTRDDYFAAPMLADPHCLFDFCLESDGAIAAVVVATERARDLAQQPVTIQAAAHGGARDWGRSMYWLNMPDEDFASSGHASIARHLYARAGLEPRDVDVALIYDHFTSQVIMQLEDYGFCDKGEGGPFVTSGAIAMAGSLPVNPDGGQLSGGFVWGMTHIREAVQQLRGTAQNQVNGAEIALVTGGPSVTPISGLLLARGA